MNRENSSRLSRRAVMAGLGLGVAAAGAYASPALQLSWTRKPEAKGNWWDRQSMSLSQAGADEWSRQIGSEFVLAGGAVAKLAEVQPLRSPGRRPDGLRDSAFAVVLESAAALPAGDRILDVSHAEAGAMKIYFSACEGGKCGSHRLQAIFN